METLIKIILDKVSKEAYQTSNYFMMQGEGYTLRKVSYIGEKIVFEGDSDMGDSFSFTLEEIANSEAISLIEIVASEIQELQTVVLPPHNNLFNYLVNNQELTGDFLEQNKLKIQCSYSKEHKIKNTYSASDSVYKTKLVETLDSMKENLDLLQSEFNKAHEWVKTCEAMEGQDEKVLVEAKKEAAKAKTKLDAAKKAYKIRYQELSDIEEGKTSMSMYKKVQAIFIRVFRVGAGVSFKINENTWDIEVFHTKDSKGKKVEIETIAQTTTDNGKIVSFAEALDYFPNSFFVELEKLAGEMQAILDLQAAKKRAEEAGVRSMSCTVTVGQLRAMLQQGDSATEGIFGKQYKTVALFASGRYCAGFDAASEGKITLQEWIGDDSGKAIHIPVNIESKGSIVKTIGILEDFINEVPIAIGNHSIIDPEGKYRESKFYIKYPFGQGELKLNDCFVEMADGKLREVKELPNKGSFVVDVQELRKIFGHCAKFVSTDELRPAMCGVWLDCIEKVAVATNAHILIKHKFEVVEFEGEAKGIFPVNPVLEWLKGIPVLEKGQVQVNIKQGAKAEFVFGDSCLVMRLIDAQFVDYNAVIPTKNDIAASVLKVDLIKQIVCLMNYTNKTSKQMVLGFSDGCLGIEAKDLDFGNGADVQLSCEYNGAGPMRMGFNAQYLLDVLTTVIDSRVTLSMSNPNRAALISDAQKTMLIMPVVLEENK